MTKHFVLLTALLAAMSVRQAEAQFDPCGAVRRPQVDHGDYRLHTRPGPTIEEPRNPIVGVFVFAGAYAGYSLGRNREKDYFWGGRAPVYSVLAGALVGAIVGSEVEDRMLGPNYSRPRRRPGYRESAAFIRTHGTDSVSIENVTYEDDGVQGDVAARSGNRRYVGCATVRRIPPRG
jgi:hypothetical protein